MTATPERPAVAVPDPDGSSPPSPAWATLPRLADDRLAEINQLEAFRPGFRDRLISLFDDAVAQQLPVCAAHDCSGEQRRRAAHAIKGAAAGIGASRLQALAQAIEEAAKHSDRRPDECDQLQPETTAVIAELTTWSVTAPGRPT